MKKRKYLCIIATAFLFLSVTACGDKEPSYEDRETFPQETFVISDGTEMVFQDALSMNAYAERSTVGEWLTGCSSPDRDDQFDAYTLRHETADGKGNTIYSYIIYYPHGDTALRATPELLEGDNEYVIQISYTAGAGVERYSLSYLTVTLPSDKRPRVRLMVEDDILGVMSTVTDQAFSAAGEN